jgi:hypothetical protein
LVAIWVFLLALANDSKEKPVQKALTNANKKYPQIAKILNAVKK